MFLFSIYNRGAFTLKPAMKFTRSVEINLPPGFIQMLTKAVSQIQQEFSKNFKIHELTLNVILDLKVLLKLKGYRLVQRNRHVRVNVSGRLTTVYKPILQIMPDV